MKKLNIFCSFLLTCGLLLAMTPNIYAARISHASVKLSEAGIKHYNEGDFASAVHELSKAIMVDYRNEEAQEYLNKMGIEEGIYGYHKSPALKISTLAQKNHAVVNKVVELEKINTEQELVANRLQGENEALSSHLQQKDDEVGHLNVKMKLAKNEFNKQTTLDKKKIADLNYKTSEQKDKIELFDRIVDKEEDIIESHENTIVRKNKKIGRLNNEVQYVKNDIINEMLDYEGKLSSEEKKYERKLFVLRKKVDYINNTLGKENIDQQEEIVELSAIAKKKDQKLVELEDDVLNKDLEIAKKDKMLVTRDQLAYVQSMDRGPKDPEEIFISVPDDDVIEKIKLLKKRDKDIARLKGELVVALKKISVLEKQPKKEDGQALAALRKKIQDIKKEYTQKEDQFKTKDSDFNMLEERLMDAQQRLNFVQRVIEEKDDQIQELTDEIVHIKNQCSDN